MRIQGISTTPFFYNSTRITKNNEKQNYKRDTLQGYYLTPAISFEARVDKGLQRFYEFNIRRMPSTVKNYIETLPDKSLYTPLGAQRNAFSKLLYAKNAEDIKKLYPEEDLFKNLVNPDSSKATRGILGIFRENRELLELCGQGILADNENLTVYLIKKIFLEGKTLDEMNEDLKRDCNPEFRSLYQQKENGMMLRSSTLKALGIEQPEFEYLQSLRYTRDGYSDLVGEKISQVQRAFWESMPPEERTARARKSVERFETWWNSLSRDQQLDKIAAQADELTLLEEFNKSDFGKTKKQTPAKPIIIQTSPAHPGTGITSSLSRDDLFKIWASNNLKLFMENLTERDKRIIQTKRDQNAALRWEKMTSSEKTEYISRIKSGSESTKFAMIDAWNSIPEVIAKLSVFLSRQKIEKPLDEIYSNLTFSSFMSKAMTNFWEESPDCALKLGDAIKNSHQKIKNAVNGGYFESLKTEIMKDRKARINQVSEILKNYREIRLNYEGYRPLAKEFAERYLSDCQDVAQYLPDEYLQNLFDNVNKYLDDNKITSWIKLLEDEALTIEDMDNINAVKNFEPKELIIADRSIEGALADALYGCTGNAEVFELSHPDLKYALMQVLDGEKTVNLFSEKNNKKYSFTVLNRKIDKNRIKELYNTYKNPLTTKEITMLIDQFIKIRNLDEPMPELQTLSKIAKEHLIYNICDYLAHYGHSVMIPFTFNNYTPEIKAAFMQKFITQLPSNIPLNNINLKPYSLEDFKSEEIIKIINNEVAHKYDFLPNEILKLYTFELNKMLRASSREDLYKFKNIISSYKSTLENPFKSVRFVKAGLSGINQLYFLCAEQTLADVLYKASGNPEVYALSIEELLDISEAFKKVKRFPTEVYEVLTSTLTSPITLKMKHKPNFYKSGDIFEEYRSELKEYLKECVEKKQNIDSKELLYILNPDETRADIDEYTLQRINSSIRYI